MPTIRTRAAKTSALTQNELDNNFKRTVSQKTDSYQILISDNRSVIEANKATATTMTLPPVATADNAETGDYEVTVTNIGAGISTVTGSGAELIDGSANLALQQWASATFILDSAQTGWKSVARSNVLAHTGALTVSGAFTSVGIDDNADSTALTLAATTLNATFAGDVGAATGTFTGEVTGAGFTGTLDGVLGGGTPAAATVTTFTSTGIDDNATSTALTLDSSQNATFAGDVSVTGEVALEAYSEDADQYTATTGTRTLDTSAATYFYPSADLGTATITFAFSNPAASGRVTSFTMELLGADGATITWPASVDWSNGVEPTWTSGRDIVSFMTRDNGTTWYGFPAGRDMS